MSALAVQYPALPATQPDMLATINGVRDACLREEKAINRGEGREGLHVPAIHTSHVIHGGMYARTITMPPNTALTGTLIKIPTIVVTVGKAKVLVGKDWADVDGVQVLPGSANRQQVFISTGYFSVTMLFPTSAKTVEEAEAEFTDQTDLLLSRRQELNTVVITGE